MEKNLTTNQQQMIDATSGPTPGEVIPKRFKNPPCGETNHYCVDHAGRYQPDWVQVFVQKTPMNPPTLIFNEAPKLRQYLVPTDMWVDVPPFVITAMNDAVEYIREETPSADPRTHDEMPARIVTKRRFFFNTLPSK